MKKYLGLMVLTVFLCGVLFCIPASADDIEGKIYSTDILAYVNGQPIDSYNIGGRTVVIAEDLDGYGFNHEYDDETRTLKVKSYFNGCHNEFAEIPRSKTGRIVGSVYATDIKVYFNEKEIKGYNIGGRTAICIEDMGEVSGSVNEAYGYSDYLGKYTWNPEDRTISFESFRQNQEDILKISRVYHRFRDNVIYTFPDDYYAYSEINGINNDDWQGTGTYTYTDGFNKNVLSPVYLETNGELTEIGIAVADPNNEYDHAQIYINDIEKARALIKTVKLPKKTHDEALEYFTTKCTLIEKMENDGYTVLRVEDEKEGLLFVYINKSGGFVVDTFFASYGDRTIKMWFDDSGINSSVNTVVHSVSPFAGPHGATTMSYATDLEWYDYE